LIHWSETPTGDFCGQFEGRQLGSARDPRKEAARWCDRHAFIKDFNEVVVVGIGHGYHLIEIKKRWPHLLVRAYDAKPGVKLQDYPDALWAELANLENCKLHFEAKIESVKQAPLGPVLQFSSACREVEAQIYDLLLGQSPKALTTWGEQLGYYFFAESAHQIPENLAVNIKSLPTASEGFLLENKILHLLLELVQ